MSTETNPTSKPVVETTDHEFTMTRVFAAPRELVWQAWTDCEHLQHWWGPKGWTLPVCKLDFREGGVWHYCMKGPAPDGNEMESWGKATYQEIVEPERIAYLDAFSDEAGNVNEALPELMTILTFEEVDGGTRVTDVARFATAAELETVLAMGMEAGLTETWNRLEAYLAQV